MPVFNRNSYNIKSLEVYGERDESVVVTLARRIVIQNPERFKKLVSPDLFSAQVSIERAVDKFKMSDAFSDAIAAVISGDYEDDITLDNLISIELTSDSKKKALLLKKLKGDYRVDRKVLIEVLGQSDDYDVILFMINKIIAYQKICMFFEPDEIGELQKSLTTCISLEDSLRFEVRFAKE